MADQSVSVSCPLQQLQVAAAAVPHQLAHSHTHTGTDEDELVDVDAPRVPSSAAFVGKIKNFEWAASGFKDLH